MNSGELASELSKELGVTVQASKAIVAALVRVMGRTLAVGEPICLSNFGTLKPMRKLPRSFGPQAERSPIGPKAVQVRFRPADRLLEAVERGDHRVTFQKRSRRLPGDSMISGM